MSEYIGIAEFGLAILSAVLGYVFRWFRIADRNISRLLERVVEKGDGLVAPMLRPYIKREDVKDAIRESETMIRTEFQNSIEKMISKMESMAARGDKAHDSLHADIKENRHIFEERINDLKNEMHEMRLDQSTRRQR